MSDEEILAALTPVDKSILIAYAENMMRLNKTGRVLNFSNNNVSYHLTRIRTDTGLDPRNFYDLIRFVDIINKERRTYHDNN